MSENRNSEEMPGQFWTPAKLDILRALWAAGTNVRSVAERLGNTRNAVIGKARRMQLPAHIRGVPRPPAKRSGKRLEKKPKNAKPRAARIRRKKIVTPDIPPQPFARAVSPAEPLRIAFADLAPHHCRYPVTAEPPHFFCGHERPGKSPFCALHHALCYEAPRERTGRDGRHNPRNHGRNFVFRYRRAA